MGNTSPDISSHQSQPKELQPLSVYTEHPQNTPPVEQPLLGTITLNQATIESQHNSPVSEKKLTILYGAAEFLPKIRSLLTACKINPDDVDPTPFGEGGNHIVFQSKKDIADPFVVKIPKKNPFAVLNMGHEDEKNQIAKIQKAFPGFSLPTEVHTSETGQYVVVQQKVEGNPITNHTTDPSIHEQLRRIVDLNSQLYGETGESLDFVGMPGFTSWIKRQFKKIILRKSDFEVSNILIDKNTNQLRIIDTDVLRTRGVPIQTALTSHIGFFINRMLMKWNFGVDIKRKKTLTSQPTTSTQT